MSRGLDSVGNPPPAQHESGASGTESLPIVVPAGPPFAIHNTGGTNVVNRDLLRNPRTVVDRPIPECDHRHLCAFSGESGLSGVTCPDAVTV